MKIRGLKRVMLKEELVLLLESVEKAIVLQYLIDSTEKSIEVDRIISEYYQIQSIHSAEKLQKMDLMNMWLNLTPKQIAQETMLDCSETKMRSLLKSMIADGYLETSTNPKYQDDNRLRYRVRLDKLIEKLKKINLQIDGYIVVP